VPHGVPGRAAPDALPYRECPQGTASPPSVAGVDDRKLERLRPFGYDKDEKRFDFAGPER
jgi:hypothetical protein